MPDDSHSASDTSAESNSQYLPASADDSSSPSYLQTDRRQIAEEELPDGVNGPDELIRRESDIDCYTPDEQENALCGIQRGVGLKTHLFTWEFNLNQNDNWVVTERVHASTLIRTLNWVFYHGFVYMFILVGLVPLFNLGILPSVSLIIFTLFAVTPLMIAVGAIVIYAMIEISASVGSFRIEKLEYGHRIAVKKSAPRSRMSRALCFSGVLTCILLGIRIIYRPLFGGFVSPAAVDALLTSLYIITPIPLISQVADIYYRPLPLLSAAVRKIITQPFKIR